MSIRIYNETWSNIDSKLWPYPKQLFICRDSQHRLGLSTYMVGKMGPPGEDLTQRGLFWLHEDARIFAEALEALDDE